MELVQRVVVLPQEPIGQINPYLHGQFAEHLGELIYPGIFVDPAGAIANSAGLRHDVIAALKPLGIPVLRWPGGCFADNYHCIKTPTYHVFDLYQPHKGAQAVRFLAEAEVVSNGEAAAEKCRSAYLDKRLFALRAVHGSASIREDMLCVTVVNTHPTQALELDLAVHGHKLDTVEVIVLSANDIHAHNTFEQPDVVQPGSPKTLKAQGERVRIPMPAGSVVRIMGQLSWTLYNLGSVSVNEDAASVSIHARIPKNVQSRV